MVKRLRKLAKRPLLLMVALVLVVALVVIGLTRKHKSVSGTIPSTPSSSTTAPNSDKAGNNAMPTTNSPLGNTDSSKSNASNTVTLPLNAPWGNFVSNHSPGKDGAPTSEVSTCNTTPGATCTVQFIKDGVSRNLETKTTDSNGSVSWSWDIKDANLSSGKWQITAVATLNGQSKSTSDQLPLEVQ
ncbi:MAG: hypothetical protein Q7R60_03800 [bacterium]|nr:hypothetical protein [bacterium]